MKNNWQQSNNDFWLKEISQQTPKLPIGVYKINYDEMTKQLFLTQVQEVFTFPYKVYGVESSFIKRVIKTYHNTTGNLGILMNGTKGTGKTVTAQMICNELKLPVLIVHSPYEGISSFINEIQQDVIVFFDEYEKMYNHYDSTVLTVMDGVLNNEFRKVFMLTTNSLHLNDNMLQRPGRLRYVKTFEDLTLDVIMEIVDDKLQHKQFRQECISFLSKLDTITIDIVKAVIEEVNIHIETPEAFKNVFNIKTIADKVNIYTNLPNIGLVKLEHSNVSISPVKFTEDIVGEELLIAGHETGEVKQVLSEDTIVVELWEKDDNEKRIVETYRVERLDTKHKSFQSIGF